MTCISLPLSYYLSLSVFLSLKRTHTHTHTHSLYLIPFIPPPPLSLSFFLSIFLSSYFFFSLYFSHPISFSLFISLILFLFLSSFLSSYFPPLFPIFLECLPYQWQNLSDIKLLSTASPGHLTRPAIYVQSATTDTYVRII